MFREFNTLELTFCVEFIIMLLLEPPSLHFLLPNSPSLPHLSTSYLANYGYYDDYNDDYHYNNDYH